jgi:hypothetical protein
MHQGMRTAHGELTAQLNLFARLACAADTIDDHDAVDVVSRCFKNR